MSLAHSLFNKKVLVRPLLSSCVFCVYVPSIYYWTGLHFKTMAGIRQVKPHSSPSLLEQQQHPFAEQKNNSQHKHTAQTSPACLRVRHHVNAGSSKEDIYFHILLRTPTWFIFRIPERNSCLSIQPSPSRSNDRYAPANCMEGRKERRKGRQGIGSERWGARAGQNTSQDAFASKEHEKSKTTYYVHHVETHTTGRFLIPLAEPIGKGASTNKA